MLKIPTSLILLISFILTSNCWSKNNDNPTPALTTLYQSALEYDAAYQTAQQNLTAEQEILPQRRATLLPHIRINADATHSTANNEPPVPTASGSSQQWSIELSQQLFGDFN